MRYEFVKGLLVVKMTIFDSDFRQINIFELIASLKKLVQSLGKKSASFRSTYISKLDVNQSRKLEPYKKQTNQEPLLPRPGRPMRVLLWILTWVRLL
jgi:hypothetical protein